MLAFALYFKRTALSQSNAANVSGNGARTRPRDDEVGARRYPQLVELDLTCPLDLAGSLEPLATARHLASLRLRNASLLNGDVAPLSNLVKLVSLDLGGCDHLAGDFADLSNLAALRTLNLGGTSLGGDLAFVKNMSQLRVLDVYDTAGDLRGTLDNVPSTLTTLRVRSRRRPARLAGTLERFARLKNLEHVAIQNAHGLSGTLAPLASLPLVALDLHGCKNLEGDLAPLSGLRALTSLDLSGSGMHHTRFCGTLEPLGALTRLAFIRLDRCPGLRGGLARRRRGDERSRRRRGARGGSGARPRTRRHASARSPRSRS